MIKLVLLILFITPLKIFAQPSTSLNTKDSLLKRLSQTDADVEKVLLLNQLFSNALERKNTTEGIGFAERAFQLTQSITDKKAIAIAKANMGFCKNLQGDTSIALKCLKESLEADSIHTEKNLQLFIYSLIADIDKSNKNYPESIWYALKLLPLREQSEDKMQVAAVHNFLGDLYKEIKDYENAVAHWTQSLQIKAPVNDPQILALSMNIGEGNFQINKFNEAIEIYLKAAVIANQKKNKVSEANSWRRIGNCYSGLGEQQLAEDNLIKAKEIFESLHMQGDVALVLNNIAMTYHARADYTTSVNYMNQSLRICEDIGDEVLKASDLNDLSHIYILNRDANKALECLNEAKRIYTKLNQLDMVVLVEDNARMANMLIHESHLAKGDTVTAMKVLEKAMVEIKQQDTSQYSPETLSNMGDILILQKKYASAVEKFNTGLLLSQRQNDSTMIMNNIVHLGKVYLLMAQDTMQKNRPDSLRAATPVILAKKALAYLEQSLNYYKRKQASAQLLENSFLISQAFELCNDRKAALEHYKMYMLLKDSIFNVDKTAELIRKTDQFEFEKKEVGIKAKNKLYALAGLSIFAISIIVFILIRKNEKTKFRAQVTQLQQEALNAQMSDHFIGNTMASINSFIKTNDKEKASDYLHLFHRLIRKVLKNAAQRTIPLKDDLDVIHDYIALEKLRFAEDQFNYEVELDASIDVYNTLVPPMVLQILVENSIKHGLTRIDGGKISISVAKTSKTIKFTVEDNGIGRKASSSSNIKETGYTSIGSSIAERLVKTFGSNSHTSFIIRDSYNSDKVATGTLVAFSIPIILAD